MKQQIVLAFGTFDGIHDGHEYFLKNAKALGDKLVVGVARDAHVRTLKNKEPKFDEKTRVKSVRQLSVVNEARLSDEQLGTYHIIQSTQPDIIAVGHDQDTLLNDLERWLAGYSISVKTKRISKQ